MTYPPWLGNSQPELVRDYLSPPVDRRARFLAERLQGCAKNGHVLCISRGATVDAVAGVEALSWDTEHFGIGCARLTPMCLAPELSFETRHAAVAKIIDLARDWCRQNRISVLQRRVVGARADEAPLFEDRGFRMVDSILTFSMSPRLQAAVPSVRPVAESDTTALLDIAREAFPLSRFLADPAFDPAKAREVYVRWLETLLAGTIAGDKSGATGAVLVADHAGVASGFLAIRRDVEIDRLTGRAVAPIEMVAMSAKARGQRLGSALLTAALDWAARHGADLVEASTWASSGLRRFYERSGFVMRDRLSTLHGNLT